MVWLVTVASLLGFLAVDSLAYQPVMANYDINTWQLLVSLLSIIFISLLSLNYWLTRRVKQVNVNQYLTKTCIAKQLLSSLLFITLLSLSASFGLYQNQRYQSTLLKSPVTLDAIVQSHQISDTLTQTLAKAEYQVGNGYTRYVLQVVASNDNHFHKPANEPLTTLVSFNIKDNQDWQNTLSQLKPGQQLKVKLQLQPIHSRQTHSLPSNAKSLNIGFDEAQWLRQRGVQAKADVIELRQNSLSEFNPSNFYDAIKTGIENLRWQLRQKLLTNVSHKLTQQPIASQSAAELDKVPNNAQQTVQNYAILLGLLTGDKSLMDSQIKNLYQVTGISHLLAISGPHVLLLATMVSMLILWLVKTFAPTLLIKFPSRLLVLWVSVMVAGFYALLVGFEIPAQRTFWMLLLLTIAKQLLIKVSPYQLLAWVAVGMMWFDTTAVGQAGFWLSFVAVGLLLKFSEQIGMPSQNEVIGFGQLIDASHQHNIVFSTATVLIDQLKLLLKIQLWLFIWMLPIVSWFFGKVSIIGIVINLFAVPLLGLIIVPLDMAAGILSGLPLVGNWLSQVLWSALANLLNSFHAILTSLANAGFAKQSFIAISQTQLTICVLIAIVWFLRGLLPRMLILPLLIVVTVLPIKQLQSKNAATLTVMDSATLGINLVTNGNESWLILADNRLVTDKNNATNRKLFQAKKSVTQLSSDEEVAAVLNNQIYPLLAAQHINKLTGIISQTPSANINELVQRLATHVPINYYWLAGFDVQKGKINSVEDKAALNARMITPIPCQTAQRWQGDHLSIEAVSGWALNLSASDLSNDSAMTTDEKIATQTCLIQVNYQPVTGKAFSALLLAGSSDIPLQMSEKLCSLPQADLLIEPYRLPIKSSWLEVIQPKLLHVQTGHHSSQQLSEDSELSLASWQTKQPDLQIMLSDKVGGVTYSLNTPNAKR